MTIRLLLLAFCLSASGLWAQETTAPAPQPVKAPFDLGRESKMDFRLNLGGTFVPDSFLIMTSAEYHLDRFFSLGPMLQFGLNSNQGYWIPTLGGRFLAPIYPWKRMEVSVFAGAGGMMWELRGVRSRDFAFTSALNLDYFLWNELSVGIGGVLNVTSAPVEKYRSSLFAGASYRL